MPMPLLRLANSIAKQETEIHIETSDGSNRLPYKRLSFPFLSIATMVTFCFVHMKKIIMQLD